MTTYYLVTLDTLMDGYPPCDGGVFISDDILNALQHGSLSGVNASYMEDTSGINTDAGPFTPANMLFIPAAPAGDIPIANLYRSPLQPEATPVDMQNQVVLSFAPAVGMLKVNLKRSVQAARGKKGKRAKVDVGTVIIQVDQA